MNLKEVKKHVLGYGSMASDIDIVKNMIPEYLKQQNENHRGTVYRFILPIIKNIPVKTVLDVGCGVGLMAKTLLEEGYDAYGVDLLSAVDSWLNNDLPKDRFFIIDPYKLELPFEDGALDFAYSIGVIEHVGTTNGHADRREDYDEIRRHWLCEVYRIIRKGGYLLIGGPNRNFPIDTHGPDSKATKIEKMLCSKLKLSIHKTWGEHFLWNYKDIERYLNGFPYEIEALSMKNYYQYKENIPRIMKPIFKFYIDNLPKSLLNTGFNPWVLALIKKK